MKNLLTHFSKIRGYFSASQSNDVGYDCRLTVVRPSFDCRATMLKFCSVLVLVFTIGVEQMWGATYTGTFTKITSTDALTTGYYVVCAAAEASANSTNRSAFAMSSTISSNKSNKQVEASSVSITSGTTITNPDDAIVYYISVSGTTCTFQNVNTSKYLYQTETGSNRRMGFRDNVGDDGKATLTLLGYQSSGTTTGFKFTFNLGVAANDTLEFSCSYNAPNYTQFFANYKGAYGTNQTPLRLFKLASSCAAPTAPTNSSNTSSSLTLATTSSSADYDFYCSTTNSTSGATALTIQSVTSGQSKEYTGLNYGTTYYYWIRKNCGGGSTSSWVAGASTATTDAPNTGLSISAGSLKPTQATFTIGDSNSPKINTYGGTYDIYYSTSDDAPTGSTVASRNESTLSWTATGLTAGTKYYYWVRGHGANANSSWVSGGNFTTPTLSSITMKTEPTTTTYFAGQTFSPTGLVITANYSNSSSEDFDYATYSASFSFSPTTATALTTSDAAVTITYGGKTVDQALNVYSVTVNKVDEDGATVSADGVTASWTVGTKALVASATAGSKYVFKEWAFDGSNNGLSITSTSSANTTVTGRPIGNVTIKAVFYKPRVVKWSVNGNDSYNTGGPTSTIAYNKEWKDLKLPTDPTLPCGDKFMGWTTTNIGSTGLDKTDDAAAITALDLMTSDNKSEKTGATGHYITDATVTFYAVFADYGEDGD